MFNKDKKRTKTYLKQNFKQLIDILRTKTVFKQKIDFSQTNKSQSLVSPQPSIYQKIDDIRPITQIYKEPSSKGKDQSHIKGEQNENKSEVFQNVYSPLRNKLKQVQSVVIQDNYGQYQQDSTMVYVKSDFLKPDKKIHEPKFQRKIGSIIHRNLKKNPSPHRKYEHIVKDPQQNRQQSQEYNQQPRYIKMNKRNQFKFSKQRFINQKIKFREIDDIKVIEFWNDHEKINERSTLKQLYAYFQDLQDQLGIQLYQPVIKKYKNCIYFGQRPTQSNTYQGFITYFDSKIYYGQFKAGFKHGHGVQINFNQHSRFAGTFTMGKKSGYFQIQKQRQNYEGYLQHGIYQGKGKLIAQHFIYTGEFQNGKKHGYGEQYNIKTGLRLKGIFKNGQYQNFNKSKLISDKSSEPQLINKFQKSITKKSSVDVNFEIQKKIKEQVLNSNVNKNEMAKNQSISMCQDSQSLFDLINNTSKQHKYDFCYENIIKRLPKIRIEGIQHKYYDDKKERSRVLFCQMDNPQDKILINNRKSYPNRPLQYQNNQMSYYQDNPLIKHKIYSPLK